MHFHDFQVTFTESVEQQMIESYGEIHWNQIKQKLRIPPSYTSVRLNSLKNETADHNMVEKVQLAMKEFNTNLLAQGRPCVKVYKHPIIRDVLVIPSSASPEQVLQPNTNYKSIIVDRLCGEAVLRGSNIYACGVMCASAGLMEADKVNIYIDIEHQTTRGFPLDKHSGKTIFVAHGTAEMARTEIFRTNKGLAIVVNQRVCADAPPLNNVLPNSLYIQNLPSSVVSHILDPKPGDTIFDMCAAPGGKTSHIGTLMQNKGILIACDRSKKKVEKMKAFFNTMGLSCISALKMDSTQSVVEKQPERLSVQQVLSRDSVVKGFFPESFDKILLDPPCSALGLRPRLAHSFEAKDLAQFCAVQRNLIWAAIMLLKPGGTLVYSTCTLNPNENERMVAYLLKTYDCMTLVPPAQPYCIAQPGLPEHGLSLEQRNMVQRFDPSATLDTMGFFCAKFIKK